MRAIMVMYDSLNRNYLPNYGDTETVAPNFARLGEKAVTFDNFYVGSLPCMPARRELHTGRYNFLHRSWGPMEPFDRSMPEILADNGVYTHCVTDHCHYWQDGGEAYLTRFSSAEMVRGQEGDFWWGEAEGYVKNRDTRRQDAINRTHMADEKDHTHVRTFEAGMRFLEDNAGSDNWFLQLEYFDPHEPFFVPQQYRDMYGVKEPVDFDWPRYEPIDEKSDAVRDARLNYRALVSMCDRYLGKILDFMDEHDMWKDTLLIVNTDHGHLIGEHGYFAKNYMPTYDQLAHTTMFMWGPRLGCAGERRDGLCQTIDIAPTLLEFFGVDRPAEMLGRPLRPCVESNEALRQYALFGYFGKHVNVTDGRHVYMRAGRSTEDGLLYNYTIMPQHLLYPFSVEELRRTDRTLTDEFSFTRGVPLMKVPANEKTMPPNTCYMFEAHRQFGDLLFDCREDPGQTTPLNDAVHEARLLDAMRALLRENEAPPELYRRLEL